MYKLQWLKIDVNLFANRKIQILLKEPDGDTYIRVWIQLLIIAMECNKEGKLLIGDNKPMTIEYFSKIMGKSEEKMKEIIKKFLELDMIILDRDVYKIKNWNEISEKNKSGKIEVVFDNPNSSTVRYAIDSICGGERLNGNLQAAQNNYAVLDYVAKRPGALGIIGVNWVSNPIDSTGLSFNDSIRIMAVSKYRNATIKNSFKPYQAYMALKDYPMTRPVYIILSDPRTGLASGFTSFVSSDRGQRIILKSGILPATQVIRLVNVRDQL